MPDPNTKRDASLSAIASTLKEQNKILEAMNENIVAIARRIEASPVDDSRPPYTMKHLVYLDSLHDEMGLSEWWQRSEERQRILNTPDRT